MKNIAELRVVAVSRNPVLFAALVLAFGNLAHRVDVFGNNELPVAEALPENFICSPTEKPLRRGRPPQHAKLVIPLDDCERSVLNVKGESLVIVRGFGEFSFGDVANDRDAADHVSFFIVSA